MSANESEEKNQDAGLDQATQDKIREFCYELALALRRITGRVIEDPIEGIPGSAKEEKPDSSDGEMK